jgi:hypothetical protein
MEIEEYRRLYPASDSAPGWDAIDNAVTRLYGDQKPKHFAATPHYALGGDDPLDGISIYEAEYDGEKYFHIVTYGFSELYYNEDAVGNEFSKFGFELTFRVKPFELDNEYPFWALNMLQNIARYVFNSGNWFELYHYFPAKGPIRLDTDTRITGLAFLFDPELGVINTPHGEVQFLQIFGITDDEFNEIKVSESDVEFIIERHRQVNPMLITDLCRN